MERKVERMPLYRVGMSALGVWDAVASMRSVHSSTAVGILRSLDSTRDPTELRRIGAMYGISSSTGGFPSASLGELEDVGESLFTHFDEVWVFEREPSMAQIETMRSCPEWLTSDTTNLVDTPDCGVVRAIEQCDAVAAFGDGCGLNMVVRRRIADSVFRALSIP